MGKLLFFSFLTLLKQNNAWHCSPGCEFDSPRIFLCVVCMLSLCLRGLVQRHAHVADWQ